VRSPSRWSAPSHYRVEIRRAANAILRAAHGRAGPARFIDTPVVFRKLVCPGCATAIHCTIGPDEALETVNGFRLAAE